MQSMKHSITHGTTQAALPHVYLNLSVAPPRLLSPSCSRPFLAGLKLLCNLGLSMRLIALVPVAFAVSASALPRSEVERNLGNNARQVNSSDPQTSLSKYSDFSPSSRRLCLSV